MTLRFTALRKVAAATFLLTTIGAAQAIGLTIPVSAELSSLTASGNGSVPFGAGHAQVDSSFTATLNPNETSGISGSFDLNAIFNIDGTATVEFNNVDIDVDLWLQVLIADMAGGNNYDPALGSSLLFVLDRPLHGDLTGSASAIFDLTTNEKLSETDNLTFLETLLNFSAPLLDTNGDPVDLNNPPDGNDTVTMGLSGLDLSNFLFDFDGSGITASIDTLLLTGSVNPPFFPNPIVLTNNSLPVPEPSTLALMGLGLAGIGYRRHSSGFIFDEAKA